MSETPGLEPSLVTLAVSWWESRCSNVEMESGATTFQSVQERQTHVDFKTIVREKALIRFQEVNDLSYF